MAAESVELGTIYLVDLVGSTRLATSIGAVRADELRKEFFALLREAIDAKGGREFKSTGDGLMVAFVSASAAVACAVLTQQRFERRYRGAKQKLRVRIGLGTGESTLRDGEYFGMPAIEASRLCGEAPPDGILVSPATRMLAGHVEGARFESFGELELKGIPEPIEAFSVVWEPLDPERAGSALARWPLPEPLRVAPRTAYVGRDVERGLLEVARGSARAGARSIVLLSGEPGIGKTRLASHAALGANADGFAVCWGVCSEDVAAPYEPWIAVCSQLVEHAPESVLADHVKRSGGEIGRMARNLGQRVPQAPGPRSSDAETERFMLFQAVAELLRVVAGALPLCVVLDDFHWADAQSVALLKHVARTVEQGALQLLVTYRVSDLTKDHPLTGVLADLRRVDGVDRIVLTGLAPDEVAELLSAGAGHALDQAGLALAGEMATETGGNPFYVGEMLRNLVESGGITFDEEEARWQVDLAAVSSLPESVRDVIRRRVDRLGPDGRDALTVAAVIGRWFDVRLLLELVEMPEGSLLDELEAAVNAMLLRESTDRVGRFTFAHALINHTLYQGLGGTRRARLHHRVALALERLYGTDSDEQLADLAMHWRLAHVQVDVDKAALYAIKAGRRALASLAPSDAATLFSDALELLGPGDTVDRCEALIGLGQSQRVTGDPAYRDTLLDAARIAFVLEDADRAARAVLANSRGGLPSSVGHTDRERVVAIERTLELVHDPDRRARLLSRQAIELLYEPDHRGRRAIAEQALALARRADDPRTTARVLSDYLYAFGSADPLPRRLEHLSELVTTADDADDPALQFWAASREGETLVDACQIVAAQGASERMVALADRLGEPILRWTAVFGAAGVALVRGELADAERLAEDGRQIGTDAGQPDASMLYAMQIILVRILQGRGGEAIEPLQRNVLANPQLPMWNATLAWTLCCLGREDNARAIVDEAAKDGFEHVPWSRSRKIALALYADAAAQVGARDAAARLYELIEPWCDQVPWSGVSGCAHARTYLGLLAAALGRDELADEHFTRAIAVQEREGMLVWAARAHLGWAEALAARGERDRAREHAARALRLARQHGYGFIEPGASAIIEAAPATN